MLETATTTVRKAWKPPTRKPETLEEIRDVISDAVQYVTNTLKEKNPENVDVALETLKEVDDYLTILEQKINEQKNQLTNITREKTELERKLREHQNTITQLQTQLQEKENLVNYYYTQIRNLQQQLREKDARIAELERKLRWYKAM